MDGKAGETSGPPNQKGKNLPGHDIFCTPENSSFLSKVPYKTLDPTRREIRLLKVLPDSGSGFVECELLPSAPIAELRGKYLALSYCAGNARNTETILVNGAKCNVFANLCHALTCARHFWTTKPKDKAFMLWADQICINQADLPERSHQVGFMRDIYQNAQQTLICLSTSGTQGKGMETLVQARARSALLLEDNLFVIWEEIIESPWWNRAWVFQEFMASSHAVFMSAHHHIHWKDAQLVLEGFIGPGFAQHHLASRLDDYHSQIAGSMDEDKAYSLPDTRVSKTADKAWFMLRTKAEWKDTAAGLTFLLARSWGSKSSDKRDRIYALLGLADPGYAITPDYSVSNILCDVLTETTKNIILFENTLDILSVFTTPPLARRPGLPSWVLDWSLEDIAGPPNRKYLDTIEYTPRGEGPAIASFRKTTHPETHQETTVMEVKGFFVKDFTSRYYRENRVLRTPKSENLEVWTLCGSPCEFFLRRESYGYRIVRWINPYGHATRPENMSKDSVWNWATDADEASEPVVDIFLGASPTKPPSAETAEPRVVSIF